MEIKGAIPQFNLFQVEQKDKKTKNHVLKGTIPRKENSLEVKLEKGKFFSKFSSKANNTEDSLYDVDFNRVTKNIIDLEIPLCETGTGGGGGSGGG
ncbi:MAG: hypothetical protein H0V82_00460 [Candidatus Protochlamydia sp.]|nr:hypothetical protein [Candidatus Protochlamydia sp.]